MLSAILVLGVASIAVILAWSLLTPKIRDPCKDRDWEESDHLLNVQILRMLLERNESRYLQRSLPRAEFESCLRKRVRLTLRTLQLVEDNTNLLMRLAYASKSGNDSECTRRADDLLAAAIQLRLNLLLARSCLYVQWLFPSWTLLGESKPYQHLLSRLEQWRLQLSVSSF
jgi:hypothetical protein